MKPADLDLHCLQKRFFFNKSYVHSKLIRSNMIINNDFSIYLPKFGSDDNFYALPTSFFVI